MPEDPRLYAPSAARNRDPILAVLRQHLPAAGIVLEIASGTGEHVAHFAAALPGLTWQPTDLDPDRRVSIDAWTAGLPNVRPALPFDAAADWPAMQVDAVLCINMIHIAPWSAAQGLLTGAARALKPGGFLALYGPFRRDGEAMAPGNAAFDADLRARNPNWGIRSLDEVAALSDAFAVPETMLMPANNLTVIFRRLDDQASR